MQRTLSAMFGLVCGAAMAGAPGPASAASYTVLYRFGANGSWPDTKLIRVADRLFGTTYGDVVSYDKGTVYWVSIATGAQRVVYKFQGSTDGSYPVSNLINVGGTLYGTAGGGASTTTGASSLLLRFGILGPFDEYPS